MNLIDYIVIVLAINLIIFLIVMMIWSNHESNEHVKKMTETIRLMEKMIKDEERVP